MDINNLTDAVLSKPTFALLNYYHTMCESLSFCKLILADVIDNVYN